MNNDSEKLAQLRHSCAHLLAAAVAHLYPDAKRTIGPSIETGFYYDFEFQTPLSDDELPKIEEEMARILPTWTEMTHEEVTADQARERFAGNPYKIELINEFSAEGQTLTIYTSGDFSDLCRGGHSENPSKEIGAFKLLNLAGAYWRGNEKNTMLTRIYGTCFSTKEELDSYLKMLEEAKLRDHKKLGPQLDLFVFSELVGSGLPLWTPKGTLLRNLLDSYVWEIRQRYGYERVEIPHITKKDLYERSGHWDKFKDELFRITTREGHEFAMKPMNCPHHTQIYNRKQWSYRELPQRYANTTMCYRDEQSGELSGLSRVRSFTQDDAHVFCRLSQSKEEFLKIWDIVHEFYGRLGFALRVRLSLHDPAEPDKYLGNPDRWEYAENMLREIVQEKKIDWFEGVGEAAFYGPKLDFMAKDSIGREWQVATIQLDMNMPERFDLSCVNENNEHERIVMIHAAIMGSIERFLSIAIEHFAGAFPVWLSPVQVQLVSVAEAFIPTAQELAEKLKKAGIRTHLDDSKESVGYKVRSAAKDKIPYIIVIGEKEKDLAQLSVRVRGQEEALVTSVDDFVNRIKGECDV